MRRKSRELALQILFQIEYTPEVTPRDMATLFENKLDHSILDFALKITDGVKFNKEKIDLKIQEASRHWKIDRMASVDRNILRSAVYEMIYAPDPTDAKIVINEAIEIAKLYGTQDSGSFVNGLLDQILRSDRI